MDVLFEASFAKDLKRIKDKQLLERVKKVIEQIQIADELSDLRHIKKMQGFDAYYRIRLGDFRIGIEMTDEKVILVRFLHRKDIYRNFPKS